MDAPTHFIESAEIRRRMAAAVAMPVALVVALAVVMVWQVRDLLSVTAWVDHTDEVIAACNQLEELTIDVESGARGYLLTGDAGFLEPYRRGCAAIPGVAGRLAALVADNSGQSRALAAIVAGQREWLALSEVIVAPARAQPGSVELPRQRQGQRIMDGLRAGFAGFRQTEKALRDARSTRAVRAARSLFGVSIGAALALGALIALFTWRQVGAVVRHYGRAVASERARAGSLAEAEAALRGLNEGLESEVSRRTAELVSSNHELESFAYSVSHDLRTPLRGIDGFAQVLLDDYGDRLDDPGRQSLSRIRAAAHRMSRLIDDLLELSRVTRAALSPQRLDLTAMAEAIVARLRAAEPDRAIAVEIAPAMAAAADPRLIEIALENLIGNAWKYTRGAPAPRIEVGVDGQVRPPVYHVRDNGAGFDMAYADKLFRPFERLHTDAQFEGNGVGLATVRRVVQRHGGTVWAVGEPGRGATIRFTLEPDRARPAAAASAS